MTEKQTILLQHLMDTLALDLADGVSPQLMMASDEYGINLFPQGDYTYDEIGVQHVLMDIADDKRAITGNIVHSASGALVTYHLIFQGTTERSLPSPTARESIDKDFNITWGYSNNHWSNLQEKKRMIEATVVYRRKVIDKWIADGVYTRDQAENAPMVHILDCWSVNLSDEFRTWVHSEYPFIRLRYIPAGLTGKEQLNDTYFHAPCKKWAKSSAEEWYSEQLSKLLHMCERSELTQVEFDEKTEALMRLGILRDQLVFWHKFMLVKLTEEKPTTSGSRPINLIKKAWSTAYKQIFTEEFQTEARLRRQQQVTNRDEAASIAIAEYQSLAQIMSPRNGDDVPHTEQFSRVLTESRLTQQQRATAVSAAIADTGNVVDQQEERSHIAARNSDGTGEGGGGADHITSNFLLWSKEALRKAIIDAGYSGSGLKNKVLPVKAVMLNLYRTHVLREHAPPTGIDTASSSTAIAATVAGGEGQVVDALLETTTSNDVDNDIAMIAAAVVNDNFTAEECDDDLSPRTKRFRREDDVCNDSTRYGI
jgi:hypothetical protein